MKYLTLAQTKRQHQYLGLPGEFKTRVPTEIVYPDMTLGRADELYYTNEQLLVDLEEESDYITEETLIKFAKYLIFEGYMYTNNLYLAVICQKDPKKEFEEYQVSPSLSINVHYIHISQDKLWAKYENIINKVTQKERLTDSEALDIAFVSKFISSKYAPEIIESLARLFKNVLIEDTALKLDIGAILGGMILKRITNTEKQNQLLRRINMRHIEKEIDKLVYDEYGDILDEKDRIIEEQTFKIKKLNNKNQEYEKIIQEYKKIIQKYKKIIQEYKNKFKQLNELNLTPKAKKNNQHHTTLKKTPLAPQQTQKNTQKRGKKTMRHIEKEIDKLVYDEYGDILDEKDKQIDEYENINEEYEKINPEYKNRLKQLNELKNLTPEAKKIINSMMQL